MHRCFLLLLLPGLIGVGLTDVGLVGPAVAEEPVQAQETATPPEPAKTQATAPETAKPQESAKTQEPAKAQEPATSPESAKAHEPAKGRPARQTWQQRFTKANLAHDGHLTQAEAKDGFPQLAKHFDDIDVEHKGYVTENDVRAWRIMRKAARRLAHPPEDKLKPHRAFQLHLPDQRPSIEHWATLGADGEVIA